MFFHILSDLHLEFYPHINSLKTFYDTFPHVVQNINLHNLNEKILILAGDIGYPTSETYFEFLNDCCSHYQHVIFIPGNHEYYHGNFDEINTILETESNKIPNLHFLLNKSIKIHDYVFIGTTLWTKNTKDFAYSIMDYNTITFKNNKLITIDDTNTLHNNQYHFIVDELNRLKNNNATETIIVITHHLPSIVLIDEKFKKYGSLNKAFYTPLDDLFFQYKSINAWICGHSHSQKVEKINDSLLILNAFGYKNENKYNTFLEIHL